MTTSNNILVVEHDPLIMALLVEVLSEEGYALRTAANGRAALAAIAHDPPALTLFDMWLPDLNAKEFLYILEVMGLSYLQLILMTTSERAAAPFLKPEQIACLAKPFQLTRLLALVADGITSFPKPRSPQQIPGRASRWSAIPGGPLRRENNMC